MEHKNRERNTDKDRLMQAVFGPFAKEVAKERLSQALSKGNLFVSETTYIKQQQDDVMASIDDEIRQIEETFALVGDVLKKHIESVPLVQKKVIQEEMALAFSGMQDRLQSSSSDDMNVSLQKTLGLSNDTLLFVYQVGHHYFLEKKYKEAVAVFFFLTLLNHCVSDYWLALGMAQSHHNENERAIYSLSVAAELNPDSPMPCYQLAKLHCEHRDFGKAKEEVEKLAALAKKDTKWVPAVEKIRQAIGSK